MKLVYQCSTSLLKTTNKKKRFYNTIKSFIVDIIQ